MRVRNRIGGARRGTAMSVHVTGGQFGNAMGAASAGLNEQNICTVRGDDGEVHVASTGGELDG